MKINEKIERLNNDNFIISRSTFYRYRKAKLIDDNMSITEIKRVLRKIEKLKKATILDIK